MQILAVDIGTGTQDIFLYNSGLDMENSFKLVLPSPTMIVHRQVRQATRERVPILLTGVTMGGGPSTWAIEAHLRAGLPVYATPEAARTFNDDLTKVKEMGIVLVSEDEVMRPPVEWRWLQLCDFDYPAIAEVFEPFGISLDHLDAVAVGVFDHGNAPAEVSDRTFRFNYLDERIRAQNRLSAFAYRREDVPASMTRLKSVVESAWGVDAPLVVMDTAPAAVLGATLDPLVAAMGSVLIANVGNFHTLAFRLGPGGIEGLFEHHTGMLDASRLQSLLLSLAGGTIRNTDVFDDGGHGALMYDPTPLLLGGGGFDVALTGPRRNIFHPAQPEAVAPGLRPYFPAPYGDMMLTGCFGLLAATADVLPEFYETIHASLQAAAGSGAAPWDVD